MTFRDFSNNTSNQHQWIVLDGDIDAGAAEGSARRLAAPTQLGTKASR